MGQMDTTTQAQLYVADRRACSGSRFFRSYHTFNFGQYSQEDRAPFGGLQVLNDDTLGPGHQLSLTVDTDTTIVLLPLVGGLAFNSPVADGFVEAGQVQTLALAKGMTFQILNPYETELINFIQLWLPHQAAAFLPASRQIRVDLTTPNTLLPAFLVDTFGDGDKPAIAGFLGSFGGREEGTYALDNPTNGVFVFVLGGVFEVANRLLHERDGLALTALREGKLAFEALSNQALLLLIEIPLPTWPFTPATMVHKR